MMRTSESGHLRAGHIFFLYFCLRRCAILIAGSRTGLPASSARAGRSRQLPVEEGRSTR